jgi:predicted phage terminase large subunit-like protein
MSNGLIDYGAAWQHTRGLFAPRPQRWANPGELAAALDPTTIQTPALDVIDSVLAEVKAGTADRVMISMAPQEGKSERASRRFPTWILANRPETRIAIISYAHRIARRWGERIRDDIAAHGKKLDLEVKPDAAADEWTLTGKRGGVYCTGIGGPLTSRAVDLLIVDDPYKDGPQADSKAWNERVQSWWTEVAVPRLGPGVAVVIIQTRWREDDLTGWLQGREDGDIWRVINIPAQADHDVIKGQTDPLGREFGQYMISARGRSEADWEARKKAMGTRAWTALCQGRPSPADGDVFKSDWWRYYEQPQWIVMPSGAHHAIGFDEIIISVDCAFKDEEQSDYVVLQVWGRRGVEAYLLDQVREQMTFVETIVQFKLLVAKWPQATLKLIEDKANGTAVINMLHRKIGGIVPVEPTKSKLERARAVTPFVEAGNVWLPDPELCLWIYTLIEEAKMFPRGKTDDTIDGLTQALDRLLLDPLITEDKIVEDDEDGDPEGSISAL